MEEQKGPQQVVVVDFNISFAQMVWFTVKFFPAMLVAGGVMAMIVVVALYFLRGFMWLMN